MSTPGELNSADRISLDRVTFLLVDEDMQSLDLMGQIVAGFGARTLIKCQTLVEAKKVVGRTTVDFVINNARKTDAEGFAFLHWLRREATEPNRFTPVVVVTGDNSVGGVRRARDAGANFVIAKPITPAILLQRIFWIARENRLFIECDTYAGPDRRFKRMGPPPGLKGRRADDTNVKLGEAKEPNLSQDEINAFMKPAKVAI